MTNTHFFQMIEEHGLIQALDEALANDPNFLEMTKGRLERLAGSLTFHGKLTEDIMIERNHIAWAMLSKLGIDDSGKDRSNYDRLRALINPVVGITIADEAALTSIMAQEELAKEQSKRIAKETLARAPIDFTPISKENCLDIQAIKLLVERKENIEALRNLYGHVKDTPLHAEWQLLFDKQEQLHVQDLRGVLEKGFVELEKNRINFSLQRIVEALEQQPQQPKPFWKRLFGN